MFMPGQDKWSHEGFELHWHRTELGSCDGVLWSESRGAVRWADTLLCAASVRVRNDEYRVRTHGHRRLPRGLKELLERHLESLNLKKME